VRVNHEREKLRAPGLLAFAAEEKRLEFSRYRSSSLPETLTLNVPKDHVANALALFRRLDGQVGLSAKGTTRMCDSHNPDITTRASAPRSSTVTWISSNNTVNKKVAVRFCGNCGCRRGANVHDYLQG
jgi:hypothetical protein